MSRSEEITSEVRKLVLTCRSLEAQLQQSIPKKTHQEIVGKMQGAIDSLSADLGRTKDELAKTTSLGERIDALESTVVAQNNMISSQNNVIGALTSKFSEALVLASTYTQATEKIQYLEDRISTMVEKGQYDSLVDSYHEIEERLANSIPKEQYYALEDKLDNSVSKFAYEEIEAKLAQMVPKEELASAESKVQDLERALLNSVPRQDFEELASKIARLSSEADAARTTANETLQSVSHHEQTMPILNQSPEQPIQELTTSEETASSVTPWGVMTIPDPVEAELQVTTERVDAPSLVHVEVPVSPQAEEVATPEPMPSEVTPVAEIAPVEIQQEIVVSTDNSETVVTSSETSEVAAPIAETFTIEQKTLDAPAAETTPVPTEAPVEVAVPIQSEPTDIHTTLAEPAATESQPPVVEEQQTTVVESTPPVEKEVAPAVGEPPAQAFDFVEQVTEQQEPVQEVNVSETTTFEPSPIVSDIQEPEATTIEPAHVESAPSDHTEIREVQSQLAEISAVAETGETTFTTAASPLVVELDRGFRFTSTEFCARSGLEFIEDLEKVDPAIVEHHCRNGDFERWFKDVLADEFAVESIKSIRESNLSGSEMRTQLVAVIAPHFRK